MAEERKYTKLTVKKGEPKKWKETRTTTTEIEVTETQLQNEMNTLEHRNETIDNQIKVLQNEKSANTTRITKLKNLLK